MDNATSLLFTHPFGLSIATLVLSSFLLVAWTPCTLSFSSDMLATDPSTLKVQVASDLHIEFYNGKTIPDDVIVPRAPVLALLGDIGIAGSPQLEQFLHFQADRFETVLFLPGNHEYYNADAPTLTVNEQDEWMKRVCGKKKNLHFLNNDSTLLNGVRVLASTLWSDIPIAADVKASMMMNDYNKCFMRTDDGHQRHLTPQETRSWHVSSVKWLSQEIAKAVANKENVLVLTHHTPSLEGTSNPIYEGDDLAGCFSTNLVKMLESPVQAWACGHTHWNFDMTVNGVRLVSNQRGYPFQENKSYDKRGLILEVAANVPAATGGSGASK